jgi:hypothetical protein
MCSLGSSFSFPLCRSGNSIVPDAVSLPHFSVKFSLGIPDRIIGVMALSNIQSLLARRYDFLFLIVKLRFPVRPPRELDVVNNVVRPLPRC